MTRNPLKFNLNQIKAIFNRALPLDLYQQLIHFVTVEKVLAPMPGRYVIHKFYKNGNIAIATSEPDINDWLELHGVSSVETKYLVDTEGKKVAQTKTNGFTKVKFASIEGQHSHQIQDEIMRCLDAGETITSIARQLGCTTANICYHRNKYKKRMAKELEVDN